MSFDPRFAKLLRFGLTGLGTLTVVSALVNIIATWQLIDAAEEQSIGITRGEFVGTYAVIFFVGAAMIFFGLRGRK